MMVNMKAAFEEQQLIVLAWVWWSPLNAMNDIIEAISDNGFLLSENKQRGIQTNRNFEYRSLLSLFICTFRYNN